MMVSRTTLVWRIAVLVSIAAVVPALMYWQYSRGQVDTEAMLDASVSIKTISHVRVDALGDSVWNPSAGSGFLISSTDCEILTNHHVVADAAHIEVFPRRWKESRGIPATIVNSNPRSDIALLRMAHCAGMPAAKMGDSDRLRPGDQVYAVGNPMGVNPDSITQGIVSHTERFASGLIPYLQTDASISRGNSGGALFNQRGEVIGVNTAIVATPAGNSIGVGYALPINQIKQETKRLHDGPPTWGDAGIGELLTGLSEREAAFFGVPEGRAAVVVTGAPRQGPSKDRLFAKDVVYGIDDTPITSVSQAERLISSHGPGETVKFRVIRSGRHIDVDITLTEGWQAVGPPGPDYYHGYLGLTLEMWDDKDEWNKHFDSPVITQVQSLGPAHLGHVTSSQRTLVRSGPLVIPVQLLVQTVTGIASQGVYHPVASVDQLERLAAEASAAGTPVLLEVETWGRNTPLNFDEPLERLDTSFHTVVPALAEVEAPFLGDEGFHLDLSSVDTAMRGAAYFNPDRGR